jgi:hypothetical protein
VGRCGNLSTAYGTEGLGTAPGELIEEVEDLLWLRRNLAGEDHVAVLVTQGDSELSGVLVDSKKEHAAVLLFRDKGESPTLGIPAPTRNHSFIDIKG